MNIDGVDVSLSPGMSVGAEVKTGTHQLIEHFISPLVKSASESPKEIWSSPIMAKAMRALKLITVAIFCFAAFFIYLTWPIIFGADKNELLSIKLKNNDLERNFLISRGNITTPRNHREEAITDTLALTVSFPDMGLPSSWKNGERNSNIMLFIDLTPEETPTTGERISAQWKERGTLKNGPMFERLVGQHDGYDVYETQPTPKNSEITRIYIFKDNNGRLVYSGNNLPGGQARFLKNINVEYSYSRAYKITPREMHTWIEKYIHKILANKN